ncbi:unnamed protein product [Taenia asiatica]|uniref:Uncharacterized protein n=1 Tax=Taenia asiatica TaxID=60517 RepID=A0A0R3VWS2_TAEAS|nr:unnamed protein product [Taenia asiatica]
MRAALAPFQAIRYLAIPLFSLVATLGGSILQTINGVRLAKPVPSQHHDNDLSLTPYAFTETEWPSLMSFGEESWLYPCHHKFLAAAAAAAAAVVVVAVTAACDGDMGRHTHGWLEEEVGGEVVEHMVNPYDVHANRMFRVYLKIAATA